MAIQATRPILKGLGFNGTVIHDEHGFVGTPDKNLVYMGLNHKALPNGVFQISPILRSSVVGISKTSAFCAESKATFEITVVQGVLFDFATAKDTANVLNQMFKTLYDMNRAYIHAATIVNPDYKDKFLPNIANEELIEKVFAFTLTYLSSTRS